MMTPWIFGDEYLYISKARNISRGIDVLADVNVGHTYPPLYSYLLSLVIGNDPLVTYKMIQFLNFGVGQLFIFLSLFYLNKVFAWTQSLLGKIFLIFLYLIFTSNSLIAGFQFVAMSENLYTPLILFIFSLFMYLGRQRDVTQHKVIIWSLSLGVLATLAFFTRTIGVVLLPTLLVSIIALLLHNQWTWKKAILAIAALLGGSFFFWFAFTQWEASQIVHEQLQQVNYESEMAAYKGVLSDLWQGKLLWFVALKIAGNHLSYLMFGSFFFPALFVLQDSIRAIKERKVTPELAFLFVFMAGSMVFSFLHCYQGFATNPIKYSTYFRYFDQSVLLFSIYGMIRWWQWMQKKNRFTIWSLVLWLCMSLVALIFLPTRDFYTTLNSFGWSWLDIFINHQGLMRVVAGVLVLIVVIARKYTKLWYALGVSILLLQLFAIPPMYRMNIWLSSSSISLIEPIHEVAVEEGIHNFYIVNDFMDKNLLGDLYFMKYLLLFYGNNFEPVAILPGPNTSELPKPFALIDNADALSLRSQEFEEIVLLKDNTALGIAY